MPCLRVDALRVPPSALFARARFPRLPEYAKPRHHLRLNAINLSLVLADTGARRSEHGHDAAKRTVRPCPYARPHPRPCARLLPLTVAA